MGQNGNPAKAVQPFTAALQFKRLVNPIIETLSVPENHLHEIINNTRLRTLYGGMRSSVNMHAWLDRCVVCLCTFHVLYALRL